MVRSLPLFALLVVAASAPPASAQHVVYPTPVVYHQPAVVYHHQPVVYHQPAGYSISNTPGMNAWQAGYLVNRPLFAGPASAHPISRPFWAGPNYDPDRVFGGSPFQSRPLLNIAVGLALR